MAEKIMLRVSAAVLLIDDFTDRIIMSPAVRVTGPGGIKPIRKADGFYVFTNLAGSSVRLTAEGPGYGRVERTADLNAPEKGVSLVWLRLCPDRTYAVPKDAVGVNAVLSPGMTLAIFREESEYFRLAEDYEKGSRQIRLYGRPRLHLEGKTCCIMAKGKQDSLSLVQLGGLADTESGVYTLTQPSDLSYKMSEARLYPEAAVSETADLPAETQTHFLLLRGNGEEEAEYTCIIMQKDRLTGRKVMLRKGTGNLLDCRRLAET